MMKVLEGIANSAISSPKTTPEMKRMLQLGLSIDADTLAVEEVNRPITASDGIGFSVRGEDYTKITFIDAEGDKRHLLLI